MLEPLAALAAEPVVRVRAGPRRHVERGVVDVPAVVERAVPRIARPERLQPLVAKQQPGVVELVGHVVEAAAHVQRGLVRHHPDRVAREAQTVAVAARQREEARVGRILLIQVGLELAVAREDLPLVREVHVHALREVPVVHFLGKAALPVVGVAWKVRQRQIGQHLHRDRVEHGRGNHVAGEGRTDDAARRGIDGRGEGVVDRPHAPAQRRLTEVSPAFQLGRHRADDRERALVVPLLERREAEDPVAPERTAERGAVHVELGATEKPRVLPRSDFDRRIAQRIHARIAGVVVRRPVKIIRARFHVQADDAAEAVAVLRVHAVLGDRDFLDRVHGRRVSRLVACPERHAVEEDVIRAAGPAACVVVVGVRVMVRTVLVAERRRDRGVQAGQVVRIPPGDRHLIDELPLQRDVGAAGIELHLDRRGFDRDRLFDPAD